MLPMVSDCQAPCKWFEWKNENSGITLDVHLPPRFTSRNRCSLSEWMPLFYLLHTDKFLIYSSMFLELELNDYVFVSRHCQNDIMRFFRRPGVLMCYLRLYKEVLINANKRQASSCDCALFATSVSPAWLIGWICAVSLPSTSKAPWG